MNYKGFEVAPVAQPLPSGLFAANLVIEDDTSPLKRAYTFDALDYFFESDHAIAYASRWARMWIDERQGLLVRRSPTARDRLSRKSFVSAHLR